MDLDRIAALVGHRIGPLRSVLASPPPEVWVDIVMRILGVHDFREVSRDRVGKLTIIRGALAQTLLWQSPAFT